MPLWAGTVRGRGDRGADAQQVRTAPPRSAEELTLKYAPDLRFRPDETFDRLDETRRLFSDPTGAARHRRPDDDADGGGLIHAPRLLALLRCCCPRMAAAAACRDTTLRGRISYTVCEVAPGDDLRLFQTAPDGAPYGSFAAVNDALAAEGRTLGFAMNAGMYHPDRAPGRPV